MYRLMVLALLVSSTNTAPLKIPKIYNALISSDENLSPSHTYPIVEPVLRTTALGVAFPPLLSSPTLQKQPAQIQTGENPDTKEVASSTSNSSNQNGEVGIQNEKKTSPQLSYHGTLYPLAFDPYLSYAYSNDFLFPALPYYEHPVYVDLNHFKEGEKVPEKIEVINPAVNFKKNPEIPDVPPPPLPITKNDKEVNQ